MYIFVYNGRKAYAASYCCKLIQDAEMINETPSTKNIQNDERVVEPEPECDVEPEEIEAPADAKTDKADGRSGDGLSWRERLEGMKGLLGFLAMIGLVAGVWSLVGSRSFNRMFDTLAGRYVSDCSKWMYFRPAIAVAIFGMTGHWQSPRSMRLCFGVCAPSRCAVFAQPLLSRSICCSPTWDCCYCFGCLLFSPFWHRAVQRVHRVVAEATKASRRAAIAVIATMVLEAYTVWVHLWPDTDAAITEIVRDQSEKNDVGKAGIDRPARLCLAVWGVARMHKRASLCIFYNKI